ncbi:hypothetical protein CL628_00095 [bacterium]|nr:hypothetical protein [bacterium]|tara:strand:+ start:321 stop:1019 length:699 start_codon:yes stop_codon:yes gene_type:complete
MNQIFRLTAPGGDAAGEIGFNTAAGVDRLLRLHHDTRGSTTIDSHFERRARVLYMKGYGAALGFPSFHKYMCGDAEEFYQRYPLPIIPSALNDGGGEDVLLVDRRPNMLALCAALGLQWYERFTRDLAVMPIAMPRWVKFTLGGEALNNTPLSQILRRFDSGKGMTLYDGLAALAHGVKWKYQLFLIGSATETHVPVLMRHTGGGPISLHFAELDQEFGSHCDKIGLIEVCE